jgi:peroxiredoxin
MRPIEPRPPRIGDPAPGFTLPAADREGTVSLADYRGTSAVLLAVNRGLWCAFCRRYIAQLGPVRDRLRQLGVETLAIVAAEPERARLYVKHRAVGIPLALDPDLAMHRAYGLSMPPMTPEIEAAWKQMRVRLDDTAVNPADLSRLKQAAGGQDELPLLEFVGVTRRLYPYETTQDEEQDRARNNTLGTGQFLVDREGVLRWARVQSATQLPASLSSTPSEAELLAAARALR